MTNTIEIKKKGLRSKGKMVDLQPVQRSGNHWQKDLQKFQRKLNKFAQGRSLSIELISERRNEK